LITSPIEFEILEGLPSDFPSENLREASTSGIHELIREVIREKIRDEGKEFFTVGGIQSALRNKIIRQKNKEKYFHLFNKVGEDSFQNLKRTLKLFIRRNFSLRYDGSNKLVPVSEGLIDIGSKDYYLCGNLQFNDELKQKYGRVIIIDSKYSDIRLVPGPVSEKTVSYKEILDCDGIFSEPPIDFIKKMWSQNDGKEFSIGNDKIAHFKHYHPERKSPKFNDFQSRKIQHFEKESPINGILSTRALLVKDGVNSAYGLCYSPASDTFNWYFSKWDFSNKKEDDFEISLKQIIEVDGKSTRYGDIAIMKVQRAFRCASFPIFKNKVKFESWELEVPYDNTHPKKNLQYWKEISYSLFNNDDKAISVTGYNLLLEVIRESGWRVIE